MTLTGQDNGEKLWERCKTIINSVAEEVLGIVGPARKGMWFDDECKVTTEDKNKAYRKMQQGYGSRSLIEECKEKRIKENTIHKRKKKEWMNVELENMELLRLQHECRKFYKAIDMARKQFKPRIHICRNEDGLLKNNEQEIFDRWVKHFDKILNRRKDNERINFTTTNNNQMPKRKTQDTTAHNRTQQDSTGHNRCPTAEETATALKK